MPSERGSARLACAWLQRARSNLALARQPKPAEAVWEDLCFDAQQAAEKAVKAILILREIDFPKTHDLGHLASLLASGGVELPTEIRGAAAALSRYALAARYPGEFEPVTEGEYRQAVAVADCAVRWAESLVHGA